jgi:hypothetical protein
MSSRMRAMRLQSLIGRGSHKMIKPGFGHAPVEILIAAHVMLDMPGHIFPGPVEVLMGLLVNPVVVADPIENRTGEKGSERQQRKMDESQDRQAKRLLALRMPAERRAIVTRIAEIGLHRQAMMLMPMKAPQALLAFPKPVKHVFMYEPFASIAVEKAEWNSKQMEQHKRLALKL